MSETITTEIDPAKPLDDAQTSGALFEEKLSHIEKCLDWSTVEKYNAAIVALAYIEEIRRDHAAI